MDVSVVWLPVTEIDRAVGFYRDTLGLEVESQDGEWAMVRAGALRLGLNARESPSGDGGAVVAFDPDAGIEAAVEQLRRDGVEFAGEISEHPWGRLASFKDPDGNDLQLYQPPGG